MASKDAVPQAHAEEDNGSRNPPHGEAFKHPTLPEAETPGVDYVNLSTADAQAGGTGGSLAQEVQKAQLQADADAGQGKAPMQ